MGVTSGGGYGARMQTNRRILLRKRPVGMITDDCFELVTAAVPEPGTGEAVVRVEYLSLDPTQRGWISHDSYLPAVPIGDVVRSGGAGTVVASRNDAYPVGARVFGLTGWQDYAVIGADVLAQVLPDTVDTVDALSVFGTTGLTAYFGLFDLGRPKAGETLVVSGAAGGVGSVVVQLGRIAGCRVVGLAGSDEKCRWVEELGADACVNYKTEKVGERLDALCPDGIDIYFDNVGGEILDECLARLALRARVIACGAISQYNETEAVPGPKNWFNIVPMRARVEGFIVIDYLPRALEAMLAMHEWMEAGKLVNRVQIIDGLEAAPTAINLLFTGGNTGKLLVKV